MRRWPAAAVALLLLAAPASAQAPKALDLVPDNALGFILINDLRQLSEHVEGLAKKLNVPERVSLLELIRKDMGIREGLNEKGSAIFIVLKGKKEKSDPEPVVALPVADYPKVLAQLGVKQPREGIAEGEIGLTSKLLAGVGGKGPGEAKKKLPVLVARKGDFALLAPPEQRAALEQVLNSRKGITAAVQPARDWLAEQDIAGVCTHHGVQVGLAMFLGGPGGAVQGSTPGQYAKLKATYAELEKNVKLIAFGGRLGTDGNPRLLTRVYFEPDGSYARWLAKAEPLQGKLLAHFPDQPYLVAGLARLSAQTNFEDACHFLLSKLPPEKADKMTKDAGRLLRRISEVGLCVYSDKAGGKQPAAPAPRAALLVKVDDAPAFAEGVIDLLKQGLQATDQKGASVQVPQRQVDGKPTWLIPFGEGKKGQKDGKPGQATQGTSPEGPRVAFLTHLDTQTVLACVADTDQVESVVRRFAKPPGRSLGANAPLQKTAALLPGKLQVAVYLDIQTLGLLGITNPGAPECPPLGFALGAFPGGVEAQFVIPYGALQAVFEAAKSDTKRKTPGDK
jgi:hypothetical protein